MIYILMIWTVVGAGASAKSADVIKLDWRPLGEFHSERGAHGPGVKTALEMCTDAARQLGLKYENYRCVRSK
jgi:hypothetical protein